MERVKVKPSYFAEQSYLVSRQIMGRVMDNLEQCLIQRKQTFRDFLTWIHKQGLPEAKRTRYRKYPTRASVEKQLNTDQLAAIILIAEYMETDPQDVMFGRYVSK